MICEGQTEEAFVRKVLYPHLMPRGIYLHPALIGRPGHKGGWVSFDRLATDARIMLCGGGGAYCTTFIDFYGLDVRFPGYAEAASSMVDTRRKAQIVEGAMRAKVGEIVGNNIIRRFIPYVQMYEFEGLLFSSPATMAGLLGHEHLPALTEICDSFGCPEDINNSRDTAPSKRLMSIDPSYDKVIFGELISGDIGVDSIRAQCPGFHQWVETLEGLAA